MWTPSWKAGAIPRVSTRFSPTVENERADAAGRPDSSRKTKFSSANDDTKKNSFRVQLTTRRIGNHARFIYNLLKVLTIHTAKIPPAQDQ